jgi:hypothetical protein
MGNGISLFSSLLLAPPVGGAYYLLLIVGIVSTRARLFGQDVDVSTGVLRRSGIRMYNLEVKGG